ncbi:MAG: DNA topoisomerase I [Deltaproteobacteria bacterium RIFCSPHIGHO2_12_FULL_43_9]|nr:MAG: DNA topoisomerase I [Deltaproteobacteria bacterium RIFCSPHIGHO2_12_FULL_43_9]
MSKVLVIVESPAKAKTIKKYLGGDFEVKASVGHIRDLPPKRLGVDVAHNFAPEYEIISGKAKVVKEIVAAGKKSSKILLGPDPDREGEAIAWHIAHELKPTKKQIKRVLFHEITKRGVLDAIEHPRELDKDKFESQQARRILDRLVGYKVSPLLWKKVRRGLSAGRVQSVAVKLIVDRENEINAFKPEEYWSITAELEARGVPFQSKLAKIDGEKADVKTRDDAEKIVKEVKGKPFLITEIARKERKRNPAPPFITSTIQQEAARKLHFTAKKTMMLAQRLYEGVEVGKEGPIGLITYMRTDSVRIADQAIGEVRSLIKDKYGTDYLPDSKNVYKSKASAQEAHEAIRPTSFDHPPELVKPHLEKDLFRLYQLIWNRFVACQMNPAIYDQTSIDFNPTPKYTFRTTGSVLKFPGFMALYIDESEEQGEEEKEGELPLLEKSDTPKTKEIVPEQHFTQPPPRFSEASLVKELEANGIGRPSTYASIISTIQDKEYVTKKENNFEPTELGTLVTDLLVENFPDLFNVEFTAGMEEQLDEIERGKLDWHKALKNFYNPFEKDLAKAEKVMRNVKREEQKTDITCELCEKPMVIKWGKRGQFLACSGYPACVNTKNIAIQKGGEVEIVKDEVTEEKCPKCGKPLAVKRGKFGRFLACSGFPGCNFTKPFSIGIKCTKCDGTLAERQSRRGKIFYSCDRYPKCDFALWDRPIDEPCPQCKHPFLTEKFSKTDGKKIICPNKDCGYKRDAD